jgi:5-methylcytosine-specific restriction endonuclease McrA
MDESIRQVVTARANDECEYCGLRQDDVPFARFHLDHLIPKQHGGSNDVSNLALSCPHCNAHKGTNLAGIDPETKLLVPLFNPRTQRWNDHFNREGPRIVGLTPEGRATSRLLGMNSTPRIELRISLER